MFQKPKYLWLSLIAFGIISYQCRSAILHNGPERDYGLWFRYLRYELFWGLITLVIPAGVIVLFMHIVSMYSSETETLVNIIGLVYLYSGGVVLSCRLYDWKTKNIG